MPGRSSKQYGCLGFCNAIYHPIQTASSGKCVMLSGRKQGVAEEDLSPALSCAEV